MRLRVPRSARSGMRRCFENSPAVRAEAGIRLSVTLPGVKNYGVTFPNKWGGASSPAAPARPVPVKSFALPHPEMFSPQDEPFQPVSASLLPKSRICRSAKGKIGFDLRER